MIDEINKILSDWDPIEIGYPLSLDEYKQYVPKIKMLMHNEEELNRYLLEILDHLGLDYDSKNSEQQREINKIVQKIINIK